VTANPPSATCGDAARYRLEGNRHRIPVNPQTPTTATVRCAWTAVERHIAHCARADAAYGEGVRKACEALGAL
jgi:catalase